MRAIKITSGKRIISRRSNRFSINDYELLKALSYIKGYKFSQTSKSIIINSKSLSLKKINGYIYAGTINITSMFNNKVYSTNKFLKQLQQI